MTPSIDVVVARYQERVEWTRNVPRAVRVCLYDKDDRKDAPPVEALERLPNLGREAHTYLHHILKHWEDLADVTVFCQGHPFDHASDFHAVLRELAAGATPETGFRWLGFIIDTDDPRGHRLFVPWSKNEDRRELRTDLFHQTLLGAPAPDAIRFYPGGQFVVTRERIHARPRAFYELAFALAATFPDGAHCFERLWDAIFGVVGVDPALLGGEPCRYLKPVRTGQQGR